jgi:hypothetical protein
MKFRNGLRRHNLGHAPDGWGERVWRWDSQHPGHVKRNSAEQIGFVLARLAVTSDDFKFNLLPLMPKR